MFWLCVFFLCFCCWCRCLLFFLWVCNICEMLYLWFWCWVRLWLCFVDVCFWMMCVFEWVKNCFLKMVGECDVWGGFFVCCVLFVLWCYIDYLSICLCNKVCVCVWVFFILFVWCVIVVVVIVFCDVFVVCLWCGGCVCVWWWWKSVKMC